MATHREAVEGRSVANTVVVEDCCFEGLEVNERWNVRDLIVGDIQHCETFEGFNACAREQRGVEWREQKSEESAWKERWKRKSEGNERREWMKRVSEDQEQREWREFVKRVMVKIVIDERKWRERVKRVKTPSEATSAETRVEVEATRRGVQEVFKRRGSHAPPMDRSWLLAMLSIVRFTA
jgi:hypothetical protein